MKNNLHLFSKTFRISVFLAGSLLLASLGLFAQTKSINHTKKKTAVAANNNGPSLKETVAWIADKLNKYAIYYGTVWTKADTTQVHIYFSHFNCKNTQDSLTNLTFSYFWSVQTHLQNGTIINSASSCDGCNYQNTETETIPFKYIDSVQLSEIKGNYLSQISNNIPGPVKCLIFHGSNMTRKFPGAPGGYIKLGICEIPIDFSKEPNLADRLIKAFNHLKTFYNQPEVKPKVKEVF